MLKQKHSKEQLDEVYKMTEDVSDSLFILLIHLVKERKYGQLRVVNSLYKKSLDNLSLAAGI